MKEEQKNTDKSLASEENRSIILGIRNSNSKWLHLTLLRNSQLRLTLKAISQVDMLDPDSGFHRSVISYVLL
jgi:hypothetical protein